MRHALAVVLASFLVASAAAAGIGTAGLAGVAGGVIEDRAPTLEPEPAEPVSVGALDPIEEHASVAPRPAKVRQQPVTRALEGDLDAQSHVLLRRLPPVEHQGLTGSAQVARWCLAHATSTSTP
jgi:hypothetical protein